MVGRRSTKEKKLSCLLHSSSDDGGSLQLAYPSWYKGNPCNLPNLDQVSLKTKKPMDAINNSIFALKP